MEINAKNTKILKYRKTSIPKTSITLENGFFYLRSIMTKDESATRE